MSTDRVRILIAALLVCGTAACTIGESGDSVTEPETSPAQIEVSSIPPITLPGTTTPAASADLAASFAELADGLAGAVGVAYLPVGGDGPAVVLGDWTSGPAWSSIKVPLAIAAYRHEGAAADTAARSAITQSDNDAAEALWESLGDPQTAAAAVQTVLAEAGDTTTIVQPERVRAGFSAFGQTDWPLAASARFAAGLPCLREVQPVLTLMGEIVAGQQWGLGQVSGALYKAGWGPDASTGGYLVRQLGVIPAAGGQAAVAIAAFPESGSFSDGTAMLDRIGTWLAQHADALPGGSCP